VIEANAGYDDDSEGEGGKRRDDIEVLVLTNNSPCIRSNTSHKEQEEANADQTS